MTDPYLIFPNIDVVNNFRISLADLEVEGL